MQISSKRSPLIWVYKILILDTFPKEVLPDQVPYSMLARFLGRSVITTNGDSWQRQRSVIRPAFPYKMKTTLFGKCGKKFLNTYLSQDSQIIDVGEAMQALTLDTLGIVAFDYDFDTMSGSLSDLVKSYNNVMAETASVRNFILPQIAKLKFLPYFRKLENDFATYNTFLRKMIEEQRAGRNGSSDSLLKIMLDASDSSDEGLTDDELYVFAV